jgi:hypothetical protein
MMHLGTLVTPLVNVLRDELLTQNYLQMDETTFQDYSLVDDTRRWPMPTNDVERPNRALTPCQQQWLEHLRACERRGNSIQGYAKEFGLSAGAMHAAKGDLRKRGHWPHKTVAAGSGGELTLVPVQLRSNGSVGTPVMRVALPNGVSIELFDGAGVEHTQAVLNALVGGAFVIRPAQHGVDVFLCVEPVDFRNWTKPLRGMGWRTRALTY